MFDLTLSTLVRFLTPSDRLLKAMDLSSVFIGLVKQLCDTGLKDLDVAQVVFVLFVEEKVQAKFEHLKSSAGTSRAYECYVKSRN